MGKKEIYNVLSKTMEIYYFAVHKCGKEYIFFGIKKSGITVIFTFTKTSDIISLIRGNTKKYDPPTASSITPFNSDLDLDLYYVGCVWCLVEGVNYLKKFVTVAILHCVSKKHECIDIKLLNVLHKERDFLLDCIFSLLKKDDDDDIRLRDILVLLLDLFTCLFLIRKVSEKCISDGISDGISVRISDRISESIKDGEMYEILIRIAAKECESMSEQNLLFYKI